MTAPLSYCTGDGDWYRNQMKMSHRGHVTCFETVVMSGFYAAVVRCPCHFSCVPCGLPVSDSVMVLYFHVRTDPSISSGRTN